MKVTIVVGGRWHAFDLARELNKQGHLYRLITNYPTWFVKKWRIPEEKIISLPLTFWAVKAIYKLGGESLMMRCQWWIHRWFAERATKHLSGSELIHGWSQWSEPSFQWAKTRGIPTVLERSSAHILEQSCLLHAEHHRFGLKWTATHPKIEQMELREYELCASVAVPSLFVEKSFIRRNFPREKLFRNGLGVNLTCFKPANEQQQEPSKDGLKIIYAGSLSVRKGVADLLQGFALASLPKATLTLLGGVTSELRPLLNKQPAQVLALGHIPQEELVTHYQQSHCFVMASIEEGMAMVQMQALACGLPLICTTNTGGEDLLRMTGSEGMPLDLGIKQFPAGFLVPIHSPKAISTCLGKIAKEKNLWTSMRSEAIKLAANQLSWESYGQRAIKHYQDLIEAAGFIGAAICKRLLADGESVIGIDNINDYYDPELKISRLETIKQGSWQFEKLDISDQSSIKELFARHIPCRVIHLAAQAGVRYSIENPDAYIQSNLVGFGNILEGCRHNDIEHLVYASSSSVYGGNTNLPFQESQAVNHPVSLYAATKKANELMAHTYSHLYGLPATGLRFFTVYGPWGRPDMAPMLFAKAILSGEPIRVFNNGRMQRDFTYIDDIVEGITRVMRKPAAANPKFNKSRPDPATSWAPHRVFNIGNSNPIPLMEFIGYLEDTLGIEAIKIFEPMQPGDVKATAADTAALDEWVGFKPSTPVKQGVQDFAHWYRDYYMPL